MVDFAKAPQNTNDPSYLGYSQGTDKAGLQPLAAVPDLNTKYVQPDYRANTSLGKLFENVGNIADSAVKFTDKVITKNLNEDLTKSINDVRDSFGVGEAARNPGVGEAAGQAGDGSLMPQATNQPASLQRLGTKIDGLYQAYQDGKLSNSAYYAKMEATVREVKARYPGYSDQADEIVKSKLGVTPANALRAALQDDVAKLSAKVNGQTDKFQNWERQNADAIALNYGGYENYQRLKAEGKISPAQTEAAVGNLNAKQLASKIEMQNISLTNTQDAYTRGKVEQNATMGLERTVAATVSGIQTQLGITNFTQTIQDITTGKRPLPSPEEKQTLSSHFALLQQAVNNRMDAFLDEKVFDNGQQVTRRALINDPGKIKQMKDAAMQPIEGMKRTLFGNEDPNIFRLDADKAKAIQESTNSSVLSQFPALATINTIKEKAGDDLIGRLYTSSSQFQDATMSGLQKLNWGRITQGGSSIRQTLEDFKKEGVNNGDLNRDAIQATKVFIQNPDGLKDKNVQKQAIEHMFGQDNYTLAESILAKSGRAAATGFFNTVLDEATVKAVGKLDNAQKAKLQGWAESAWGNIYKTEVDNANQATANYKTAGNLKLVYDPQQNRFSYQGNGILGMGGYQGQIQRQANAGIEGLNSAIQSMKRVWSLSGTVDMNKKLFEYLPTVGVAPGTPIYKVLQDNQPAEPEK